MIESSNESLALGEVITRYPELIQPAGGYLQHGEAVTPLFNNVRSHSLPEDISRFPVVAWGRAASSAVDGKLA